MINQFPAPVYSMDINDLPGTRARPLIKERNVDADHFISAYLGNEMKRNQRTPIIMRNPMYADHPYQQFERKTETQRQEQRAPTIHKQESQPFLNQQQYPIDSIDRLRKNQSVQTIKNEFVLPNDPYFKRNEAAFWGIDEPKTASQKTFTRHGIFGSKEQYRPMAGISVNFGNQIFFQLIKDLYDRPQYKDYSLQPISYKQIVESKNRYKESLDFITGNKVYGFGQRGFTNKPIYSCSKPQNIDRE
ncbi:hypothetical protein pb186bvf_002968 [Paramecium bursaria]